MWKIILIAIFAIVIQADDFSKPVFDCWIVSAQKYEKVRKYEHKGEYSLRLEKTNELVEIIADVVVDKNKQFFVCEKSKDER